MIDKLTALKKITTIVADSSNIDEIKLYKPQDATTNPTLILKAIHLPKYQKIINESIYWAKKNSQKIKKQIKDACDKIMVMIGAEILKIVPGKISTEIDARLSYNIEKSIKKAKKIIKLYEDIGVKKNSVLIKIASTWQGIRAAEYLKNEGIKCNLTLLFSFAQARACADAKVFLISPFVGRILDWYQLNQNKEYKSEEDPGVASVYKIYKYYKKYNYKTLIMGASFRNIYQILELIGCDMLTISPILLKELSQYKGNFEKKLFFKNNISKQKPSKIDEAEFLWLHNKDKMALNKLSEGINNFAFDQEKIEKAIYSFF